MQYCESPWVRSSEGAHLATIGSQADLDAMNELMGCTTSGSCATGRGNDTSWKWTSGDASTFEAWGGRGPGASRGGFDCAYQSLSGSGAPLSAIWRSVSLRLQAGPRTPLDVADGGADNDGALCFAEADHGPGPASSSGNRCAKHTFYYDAPLWTNDKLLDDGGESKDRHSSPVRPRLRSRCVQGLRRGRLSSSSVTRRA